MILQKFIIFEVIMGGIVILNNDAKICFINYFNQQVIASLTGKREGSLGIKQFKTLITLINTILPMMIITLIVVAANFKNKKIKIDKNAVLLFVIALSASLPIAVSPKQRDFYFVACVPYYAIAAAGIFVETLKEKMEKISYKSVLRFFYVDMIIVVIVLFFLIIQIGKYDREKEMIEDAKKIASIVPSGTIIETNKENATDWSLVAYLERIGDLSIGNGTDSKKYILLQKSFINNGEYNLADSEEIVLHDYKLYILKN